MKRKRRPAVIRVDYCKNCSGQGKLRGLFSSRPRKCRKCNGTGRL